MTINAARDRLIVLISSGSYHKYAQTLIASISITNDISVCWVQLKDSPTTAQQSFEVKGQTSIVSLSLIGNTDKERRTFAATCRFEVLRQVLRSNSRFETALYVDSDSIVRGSLDELFEVFERSNAPIGLRVRDEERHPFLSGVILIRRQLSESILDCLVSEVSNEGQEWGADQDALKSCFARNPGIRVHELDPRHVGWDFRRSLVVWSAKGHSRRRQLEFILESFVMRMLDQLPRRISRILLPFVQILTSAVSVLHVRERYFALRSRVSFILR